MRFEIASLSQAADVSELPTEFRIFSAGVNDSTKGPVTFDEVSMAAVLDQQARHGVDFMIDLEHYSLFAGPDSDPTAADARGWFRLEARGGELWAVPVTWTTDGADRLRNRRQRYTSPAFRVDYLDDGTARVMSLINVALTALPASYQIDALIAASARVDSGCRSGYVRPSMASIPATAEPTPAPVPAPVVAAPPAETPAPVVAADADEGEDDEVEVAGDPPVPVDVVAQLSQIGGCTAGEAVALFRELLTERRTRQDAERRSLVGDLVALGAETPATAWSNGSLVARLASEGLDALRVRVTALRSARGTATALTAPATGDDGQSQLEDFERRDAAKIADPVARERFIRSRIARKQK